MHAQHRLGAADQQAAVCVLARLHARPCPSHGVCCMLPCCCQGALQAGQDRRRRGAVPDRPAQLPRAPAVRLDGGPVPAAVRHGGLRLPGAAAGHRPQEGAWGAAEVPLLHKGGRLQQRASCLLCTCTHTPSWSRATASSPAQQRRRTTRLWLLQVIKMLRFNGTKVPSDYEARFQLALWAFRHARVYCTTEKVGPRALRLAAWQPVCVCYSGVCCRSCHVDKG